MAKILSIEGILENIDLSSKGGDITFIAKKGEFDGQRIRILLPNEKKEGRYPLQVLGSSMGLSGGSSLDKIEAIKGKDIRSYKIKISIR